MLKKFKQWCKIILQEIIKGQQQRAEKYLRDRGYDWDNDNRLYYRGKFF